MHAAVFRGFLYPSLTKYMPTWAALLLSSLAFGLCHLSLRDLPGLTALGMLLGAICTRRWGREVKLPVLFGWWLCSSRWCV